MNNIHVIKGKEIYMKKKLVLMMSALMAITLLAGCKSKHVHNWGAITYTWAEDNSTCTARRVCAHDANHVEEETVNTTYVVVEEAKCEEDGKVRYTADFTSEAFVDQTKDTTLEAIGHDLTAHDAHAETCTEAGNGAYWSCERCGKFFSDAEGKNEIENNSWIIPAHHTLTHHAAKAATRVEDGNIEYWSCARCGKFFSDAEGTNEIDAQSVIIPALGTDKSYFVGTRWNGNDLKYTLYLDNYTTYYDSSAKINYRYDDFNYDDDTKELSFTISKIENYNIYTPKYNVGDVLTFTYNAKEDVLTFEGMTFVKSSF